MINLKRKSPWAEQSGDKTKFPALCRGTYKHEYMFHSHFVICIGCNVFRTLTALRSTTIKSNNSGLAAPRGRLETFQGVKISYFSRS